MITILGAGAIGQLLAHKLTEASIDCQLIVKADAQYSSEWCLIHQDHQIYHEIPAITAQDCDELRQVWVCVKSNQLEAACGVVIFNPVDLAITIAVFAICDGC